MNNNKEKSSEQFSINDMDMYYIIVAVRALRLMSNKKSQKALFEFLKKSEVVWDGDGKWKERIQWNKPSMEVMRKIEAKFTNRLKTYGIDIIPPQA